MNKEELLKKKIKYYDEKTVKKLFWETYDPLPESYREVALLEKNGLKFRGITFTNYSYFVKTFFHPKFDFGIFNRDVSIYVSKARLSKPLPRFSFNLRERNQQTSIFYKNEYHKYIKFFDLFFDFDCDKKEEIPSLIHEVKKFVSDLDSFGLKFELVFSGSRGFKILVYNEHFKREDTSFIHNLVNEHYKFKYLDHTCLNIVPSKLMKLNFTIVPNKLSGDSYSPKIVFPIHKGDSKYFFNYIALNKTFGCFGLSNSNLITKAKSWNYSPYYNEDEYKDVALLNYITYLEEVKKEKSHQ